MDNNTIFTKTAKGLGEALGKTKNLSRDQRKILKEIDGQATLGDLQGKLDMAEAKLQIALTKMLAEDYIREFGSAAPVRAATATRSMGDTEFGFTLPARLENADSQLTIGDFFRAVEKQSAKADKAAGSTGSLDFKSLLEQDSAIDLAVEHAARSEEMARMQQARRALEEEAERQITARAQQEADTAARRKAEEQARQAVEQARRDAEEKARQQAAEQAQKEAEQQARRAEEEKIRQEAEAQAKQVAEAARLKAEQEARLIVAEQARAADARAQQARVRAEQGALQAAQEQARQKAEEAARLEAQEQARQADEELARQAAAAEQARILAAEAARQVAEAEEQARREAAEKARQAAEEQARLEAQELARLQAEEAARREAEQQARQAAAVQAARQAEEQARLQAIEDARLAAEARAQAEAQEQARREAEELARQAAQEQARIQAEEAARLAAEARAQAEAQAQARREAEEKARQAAQEQARLQAEEKARQAAEEKAQREAEAQAKKEAKEQAKKAAEEQARAKAEEKARLKAQEQARKDAEAQARKEAKEQARREAEEQARLKAEEKAHQAAEAQARLKAEQQAQAKAAQQAAREAEPQEPQPQPEPPQPGLLQEDAVASTAAPHERHLIMVPANLGKLAKWAAFGLMLLLVSMLGLVHVMPFNSHIAELEQIASGQLRQPVSIGSVRLSLFPQPHWRLQQVAIGKEGQITAAQVDAHADLGSLFGAGTVFKSIVFDSPVVNDEGLDWLLFGQAKTAGFKIASVSATNARLKSRHLQLPEFEAAAEIGANGNWELIVLRSVAEKLRIELQPKDGAVQIDLTAEAYTLPFGSRLTLDKFNLVGIVNRNELAISKFNGVLYDGLVSGSGVLKWNAGWSLNGDLTAKQIDPVKFMPAMLQSGKLEASMKFSLQANEPGTLFAAPRGRGSFTVGNGVLAGVDLANLVLGQDGNGKSSFNDLSGEFTFDGGKTQLSRMRLAAGLLSASGDAQFDAQNRLSGRFAVNLNTSTRQEGASLNLSGTLDAPRFAR